LFAWLGCPDLSDPHLPINSLAPDFVPLEKKMPRPPFTPRLKDDPALAKTFQEPSSLTFVKEQLAERRRLEDKGLEFVFAPLLVTLENMETFIKHIGAGKQFKDPLTPEETAALTRIDWQTAQLVTAKRALYKHTLRLALSLTILCEIVTQRLVVRPLSKEQPGLARQICTSCPSARSRRYSRVLRQVLAALPLTEKPEPDKEHLLLRLGHQVSLNQTLVETIHNQNLLLYPSFQPLKIADFCRFGHLPLHPVGLITDYMMGADGELRTPLCFAEHDLSHMEDLIAVGDPDHRLASVAEVPLYDPALRLDWRCLLLDRIPDCLTTQLSQPALQFLLFRLLHEKPPELSVMSMSSPSARFPLHLEELVNAHALERHIYEDIYREITTDQAAIAVLWTMRLWSCWQAADCHLSQKQLQACAQAFIDRDMPRLDQHLRFLAQHRSSLRQLFAEHSSSHNVDDDNRHAFEACCGPDQMRITFFTSYDPDTGLHNVDTTEIVYFHWLCGLEDRRAIEKRTCMQLPEGTGSEPDTPRPATPEPAET